MRIFGDSISGNCLKVKWTADIALVAYTRVAHHGGFDLADCSAVRRWVGQVERLLGLETAA